MGIPLRFATALPAGRRKFLCAILWPFPRKVQPMTIQQLLDALRAAAAAGDGKAAAFLRSGIGAGLRRKAMN